MRSGWPKDGLPKLWQAEVGIGFSSIAVAQGLAVAGGHADGSDTWFAFDAASGELRWKHTYRCAKVDNLHEGGTGSTPAIDGDAVYVASREGEVFCLDAKSGEVRWSKKLASELGVKMPEWGFTSSPRIRGEQIFLDLGCVVAVNKKSGEIVWKTEKHNPGYGTPTLFERGGKQLVAVLNNEGLLILTAEKGEQVASSPWVTDYATNSTTPLVAGDTFFLSTGYNRGCTLLKWTDDSSLEAVYEHKKLANHMNNSIPWEGFVYGIHGNSHAAGQCRLTCLELATGDVRWSERGFGCGSVLVADGTLFILSDAGELVLADGTPEAFREKGRMKVLDGRCWTMPTLANQRLYVRDTPGHVVCLSLEGK